MKLTLLISTLFIATAGLMACGEDIAEDNTYAGSITQESESSLASAPLCDVDTPCANGLECMHIAALGTDNAVCIDAETACDVLECGDGECLILESYPAQLMCSGPDDGGSSDDNCTVSNDGTTECDDDTAGSDQGAEPGDS